ncbi:hypothetical protein OROHE_024208 [Orobanche hederae]
MARKRKDGYSNHDITNINDDSRFYVDRSEIMRLTKMAKAWEFTCSFCFKKFPSAQAMGGHQNAHRHERLEERRLYIKDPIGYRKRAYLKALREASTADDEHEGGPNPSPNLHAAKQVVKYDFVNINGPPEILHRPLDVDVMEFNAVASAHGNNNNNYNYFFDQKTVPFVVMNFLPPKELSLAESVGICAEEAEGDACIEFDVGGYGMDLDQKLDLTLKL